MLRASTAGGRPLRATFVRVEVAGEDKARVAECLPLAEAQMRPPLPRHESALRAPQQLMSQPVHDHRTTDIQTRKIRTVYATSRCSRVYALYTTRHVTPLLRAVTSAPPNE